MSEAGWNGEFEFRVSEKKTPVYDLENRLLAYSVCVIKVVEMLPDTRTGNHVAG
jgi:hypothetical protein